MKRRGIVGLGILGFVSACMVGPVQMAPSSTPITPDTRYTILGDTEGSACGVTLYVPPLPLGGGGLHRAVEDALTEFEADGLIDVTVDQEMTFFLIGHTSCTKVHGKAIKILNR